MEREKVDGRGRFNHGGKEAMNIQKNRKAVNESFEQLTIQEMNAQTQTEKDIIHLKKMILNISPYSRYWRWGYVGSLRRAIKALEKVRSMQENAEEKKI